MQTTEQAIQIDRRSRRRHDVAAWAEVLALDAAYRDVRGLGILVRYNSRGFASYCACGRFRR
jgi:hypothetical protein